MKIDKIKLMIQSRLDTLLLYRKSLNADHEIELDKLYKLLDIINDQGGQ